MRIIPGIRAGQKNAPICTRTCAAQTTATSLAGERAKTAKETAMLATLPRDHEPLVSYFYHIRNTVDTTSRGC
jgi:hypothetical protein